MKIIKPNAPIAPASTLPFNIIDKKTCRHCGTGYSCSYQDYDQWLAGDMVRPWLRERTCSAACYAVVGPFGRPDYTGYTPTKIPTQYVESSCHPVGGKAGMSTGEDGRRVVRGK